LHGRLSMRLSLNKPGLLSVRPKILAYGFGVVLVLTALAAAWFSSLDRIWYLSAGWLAVVATMVWWGNRTLTRLFDRLLPWNRWGNLRFFFHLFLGLVYLLLLVNLTYLLLKVGLTPEPPTREQFVVMNVWGAFIFVPAFSIYFSLHFLKHWRKSELEVERYQKEHIRSQLNQLRNHLDPHFLFNNLNILSALVDKDPERSKRFLEKFANVYRNLLRTASGDLVTLDEEIQFIESYMYLIRTRFENNILFTIDVNSNCKDRCLPPATVQMLIENAIKHNIITESQPLAIQVLQLDEDFLIISNTLNARKTSHENSDGSGLDNIRKRYAHFTDKEVKIIKSDTHFEVHIPLLEMEQL
jgi:hypothetical protein